MTTDCSAQHILLAYWFLCEFVRKTVPAHVACFRDNIKVTDDMNQSIVSIYKNKLHTAAKAWRRTNRIKFHSRYGYSN